jgi:hypothetical protein
MRAISLWQPWASAVALGSKTIETRHWSTDYRGPIAIHAAKRLREGELIYYHSCWNWQGALRELGTRFGEFTLDKKLPFGAIVAVAYLIDCKPTEDFTLGEINAPRRPKGETSDLYNWTEAQMGNFDLGRFGWVLRNVKPLSDPIPFRGQQGFFQVPDDLLKTVIPR